MAGLFGKWPANKTQSTGLTRTEAMVGALPCPLMVMMPPTRVVAAVPTFARLPAADGNAVVEATAAFTADGNAVVEATADLEATASVQATTAAV